MPKISLTDFVDFVITSGTPKLTKVRTVKNRPKYKPSMDYWKSLREGIQAWHREDSQDAGVLDGLVRDCRDVKKVPRYHAAVRGYRKFLGAKRTAWFEPPVEDWTHGDLSVHVNPELGLAFKGTRHIVKLYFKDQPLTKRRIDVVLGLMSIALAGKAPKGSKMAVLDVSSGKVFTRDASDFTSAALLKGEAASFSTMWKDV